MGRCIGQLHGMADLSVMRQRFGDKGTLVPCTETICCQFSPGLSLGRTAWPTTWRDLPLIQIQGAKEPWD